MLTEETVQELSGRLYEIISFLTPGRDTRRWNAACIDVWISVHHITTSPPDTIIIAGFNILPCPARYVIVCAGGYQTQTDRMKETSIQLALPKLRHSMFYVRVCIKNENSIISFGMMQIIVNRAECVYGLIIIITNYTDLHGRMYYQYVLCRAVYRKKCFQ